jgi:hypothetical protein
VKLGLRLLEGNLKSESSTYARALVDERGQKLNIRNKLVPYSADVDNLDVCVGFKFLAQF